MNIPIINPLDLLNPEKRKELEEQLLSTIDSKKIRELKKIAQGGKGISIEEAENARYILFLLGETYISQTEKKQKDPESIWKAFEKLIPFGKEKRRLITARAEEEEREFYGELLRHQKLEGMSTNFNELRLFLQKRLSKSYLVLIKLLGSEEERREAEADFEKSSPGKFIEKYKDKIKDKGIVKEYLLKRRLKKLGTEEIQLNKVIICFRNILRYESDLKKLQKIDEKDPLKAERLREEIGIVGPQSRLKKRIKENFSILDKYNPVLARSVRRLTIYHKAKMGNLTPRVQQLLLQAGRPDLVYGPERLVEYLKRMDGEGKSVTELSPLVWTCTKAIDALSDAQLYELANRGSAAAVANLRNMVAKNPWLLISNKNPGGPYKPRRGTGISKFVLKSMFELEPDLAENFFIQAKQIMPKKSYESWVYELIMKYTGEDVLGWDVTAFLPKIRDVYQNLYEVDGQTGKIKHKETGKFLDTTNPDHLDIIKEIVDPNSLFMVITRHVDPAHLGIFPPHSPLAEKRKPLITQYIINNQGLFTKKETRKYLKLLEKDLYGKKKEIFENEYKELINLREQIERSMNEGTFNNESKEKLATEVIERLEILEKTVFDLTDEEKIKFQELKNSFKDLLNTQEIEINIGDNFDFSKHASIQNYEPNKNYRIKKIIDGGWQITIDNSVKIIKKPLVEIEEIS